jgi:hypothetical protein
MPAQILELTQRMLSVQKARAADGKDLFRQQAVDTHAGIVAQPVAQADVHIVPDQVDESVVHIQAHIDAGMAGTETLEARHQPGGTERRRHAHRQRSAGVSPAKGLHHFRDAVKNFTQARQQRLAGWSQLQGPVEAVEEHAPERVFQSLYLVPDRRRGDVQLLSGLAEAQMSARRLEGTQGIQGR